MHNVTNCNQLQPALTSFNQLQPALTSGTSVFCCWKPAYSQFYCDCYPKGTNGKPAPLQNQRTDITTIETIKGAGGVFSFSGFLWFLIAIVQLTNYCIFCFFGFLCWRILRCVLRGIRLAAGVRLRPVGALVSGSKAAPKRGPL